jgi:error-prone DNA polymerase
MVKGFGDYGFPESHAASFALLVYVSAWLKCHEPAAYAAGLLNSQPLGFYSPAQIIYDAQRHGVEVYPVNILKSDDYSKLVADKKAKPAIQLGLRSVKGLSEDGALRLVTARKQLAFVDLHDLKQRAPRSPAIDATRCGPRWEPIA